MYILIIGAGFLMNGAAETTSMHPKMLKSRPWRPFLIDVLFIVAEAAHRWRGGARPAPDV